MDRELRLVNGQKAGITLFEFSIDKPDIQEAYAQSDYRYIDQILLTWGYRPLFAPHSPFSK